MAWKSTDLISSEVDASTEGGRVWTDIYRVQFTNRDNSPLDAINAPGIPADYSQHPKDQWATNRQRTCRYENLGENFAKVRLVTCIFKTKADDEDPNEDGDPLFWPAKWSLSFQQYNRPAVYDVDGKLITNSAGETFPIEPLRDESRAILQCTKNFSSFDPDWIDLVDKINSSAWGGFKSYTVKISNVQMAEQYTSSTTPYYATTWTFNIRQVENPNQNGVPTELGWREPLLSRGYSELVGGVLKEIKVGDPEFPPRVPQFLNDAGAHIADPIANAAQRHYVVVKHYDEISFATELPIPAPFNKS